MRLILKNYQIFELYFNSNSSLPQLHWYYIPSLLVEELSLHHAALHLPPSAAAALVAGVVVAAGVGAAAAAAAVPSRGRPRPRRAGGVPEE